MALLRYGPFGLHAIIKTGALGFVLKSDADRDLVSAVEAVWRGEPYVSRRVDAMLPASSWTTPIFMLLAESDLLTAQEREPVRFGRRADAAFALIGALSAGVFGIFPARLRKVSIESSIRTQQFPVS